MADVSRGGCTVVEGSLLLSACLSAKSVQVYALREMLEESDIKNSKRDGKDEDNQQKSVNTSVACFT
ncbi:hypothetical protein ACHQM5_009379 [Ranunculus cassubicifolius]